VDARDHTGFACKKRKLLPILIARIASLILKEICYEARVRSVIVYGSETWSKKVEDMQQVVAGSCLG